ncbi:MAG: transposase, partial [Magnetococcales bacterium]|nr:transposase [Magnetococcales bacterium]
HQNTALGWSFAPETLELLTSYHWPGQVRVFPYERANGQNTVDVLQRLRDEFPDRKIKLVWDGATYHRSRLVRNAAMGLKIDLFPLPGYSPDFMPVESLWRWLREEITYFFCHENSKELIDRVAKFVEKINQRIYEVADRLWVTDTLDPEVEKLRIPG